jgi:hypothetical protein
MLNWLAGKKTYILAAVVFVVVIGLVFFGRLTPAVATSVVLFALPLFAATFRSTMERHHDEVVDILTEVAIAGAATAAHNSSGALKAGVAIVEDGARLATEVRMESADVGTGAAQ